MGQASTVIVIMLLILGGIAVTTSLTDVSLSGQADVTIDNKFSFVNERNDDNTSIDVNIRSPASIFLSNQSQKAIVVVEDANASSLTLRVSLVNRGDSSGTARVSPQVLVNDSNIPFTTSTETAQRDTVDGRLLLPTENHTTTASGDALAQIAPTNDSTARTFLLQFEFNQTISETISIQLTLDNTEQRVSVVRPEEPGGGGGIGGGGDAPDDPADSGPPFAGPGNPQPDIDDDGFKELGRDVDRDGELEVITTLFTGEGDVDFDLVAVDNGGNLTNISTGGLRIPSNNTDSAAIGPPLDYDGDNVLEVPFVAKTSDGSGPFLYISSADQAVPERITEIDKQVKALRLSRGNLDNDSFADILVIGNNNEITAIDGNDIAPRVPRERGLETLNLGADHDIQLNDVAKANPDTDGNEVLFAVGANGAFVRFNETLEAESVQTAEELAGSNAPSSNSKLTAVTTAQGGTEVWAAGGNGQLLVYNRSTGEFRSFKDTTRGNQIDDLVVVSPNPSTRVVLFVDGQQANNDFPIRRLTINRNGGTYAVNNQSNTLVPSSSSLKAIAVQNETVFVGGKQQIYRVADLGTGDVSQVGEDVSQGGKITALDVTESGEIFAVRVSGDLVRTVNERLVTRDVNRHDAGLRDIEMINSSVGTIGSKTNTAALFVRQPETNTFELFDAGRQENIRGVSALDRSTSIGVSTSGTVYKLSSRTVSEERSSARFFAQSTIGRIDLDGDGATELLFKGSNNGNIIRIDDGERRTEIPVNDANFQISRIGSSVRDIDNDGQLEFAFVDGNQRLRIVNLDTGRSLSLDVSVDPKTRHVAVLDIDDDQVAEIVYISKDKQLRVVDIVEDENRILRDGDYHTAA